MYLNYLEKDEQNAFLKLAHIIANADERICENEKAIIGSYCNEMNINDISFATDSETIEEISKVFKSTHSKKIVMLELMSIVNANGEFKDSEKEIINRLMESFELESSFFEKVESWSKSLMTLIEHGTALVLKN